MWNPLSGIEQDFDDICVLIHRGKKEKAKKKMEKFWRKYRNEYHQKMLEQLLK